MTQETRPRGLPLPGLGRFHVYAWWAFVFGVFGLIQDLLIFLCFQAPPAIAVFGGYGVMFALMTLAFTVMIAIHTYVGYWWPRQTATDRARKPTRRDLGLAAVALGLAAANVLVLIWLLGSPPYFGTIQ